MLEGQGGEESGPLDTLLEENVPIMDGPMMNSDNDDNIAEQTSINFVTDEISDPGGMLANQPQSSPLSQSSRREWLESMAFLSVSGIGIGILIENLFDGGEQIAEVNYTRILSETQINIALDQKSFLVCLEPNTLQKQRVIRLPSWIPKSWTPPAKIIDETTDEQVVLAAWLAGTVVEMIRTSLLYPLLTLKTRIQTRGIYTKQQQKQQHIYSDSDSNSKKKIPSFRWKRRLRILQLNALRHYKEGDLYAGLLPTLFVTAPTTGLYYAIRDVSKRSLVSLSALPHLSVALGAALFGSIVSIAFRTPVDALAARLQVVAATAATTTTTTTTTKETINNDYNDNEDDFGDNDNHPSTSINEEEEAILHSDDAIVGNWFIESLERLPSLVLTEVPYLLLRIILNDLLLQGTLDLGRYELLAITSAIVCGILTTPFDVARTRMLIDSDSDPTNGLDGGSGEDLMKTFARIVEEEDGDGYYNLYRGWFERALYLGIGRAWLEPLQLLGYIALRDAALLQWF